MRNFLLLALICFHTCSGAISFYVSPSGDDKNNGTTSAVSVKSLERARSLIATLKAQNGGRLPDAVIVELAGGVYTLNQTFQLGASDSGNSNYGITYRGSYDSPTRIIGGRFLSASYFIPVPATSAVYNRLDAQARSSIVQINLTDHGITQIGMLVQRGFGRAAISPLELFVDSLPMTLARWPNQGNFVRVNSTPDGKLGLKIGYTDTTRPLRWIQETNIWAHGYWFFDWADFFVPILDVNTQKATLIAETFGSYGVQVGQRYFMANLLSEIDIPGEYYVDNITNILYFYPPYALNETSSIIVSMINSLVNHQASYVSFENIIFEVSRGTAIIGNGGTGNMFKHLEIRNTGSKGIFITSATNHTIDSCYVHHTGEGGIQLTGGNRATLASSGNLIHNSHIWQVNRWAFTYMPSIHFSGVGTTVSHNYMHHTPHAAILFSGNNHLIEYNKIHDVVQETGDAGAIYIGRDWTFRGNVIRFNFMYHINGPGKLGTKAIYLDDQMSSSYIYGNVFYDAFQGIYIGGGRDSTVANNIFINCSASSFHLDARGLGICGPNKTGDCITNLGYVPYQSSPWNTTYPELVNILDNNPAAPLGNNVSTNVHYGVKFADLCGTVQYLHPQNTIARTYNASDFVDASALNFQLVENHVAYSLGFQKIPFDRIGLDGSVGIQSTGPIEIEDIQTADGHKSGMSAWMCLVSLLITWQLF